jgi:hypothetical protein
VNSNDIQLHYNISFKVMSQRFNNILVKQGCASIKKETLKNVRSTTIQDKKGKCLTEEDILQRWTEYCSELYNYRATGDHTILNTHSATNNDSYPILREEIEVAMKLRIKKGEISRGGQYNSGISPRSGRNYDRCPAEYMQQDLANRGMAYALNTVPDYYPPQNSAKTTISLISHPSKVMLKILLNRLKPQAGKIIDEEQAGFRARCSTTEQIFNLNRYGQP